jgi:hypothetical protein
VVSEAVVGAVAGVLGGIIGAVVGGLYTLRAATKQIEVMMVQLRGDVNERLYNQNLEIMHFFAENPKLRPYFYDNKELTESESEEEKMKILGTAEMVAGFMELVAIQITEIPEPIQARWKKYIVDEYNSSPVLRQTFERQADWYADEILKILPKREGKTLIAQSGT